MFPIPGVKDTRRLAEARNRLGLKGHPPVILIIGEKDIRFHMLNAEANRLAIKEVEA